MCRFFYAIMGFSAKILAKIIILKILAINTLDL
jgi:hypothetical protein